MSNRFPFYTEQTHTTGAIALTSSNGARDTATLSTEGRLVVDAADKVSLLEPNRHSLVTLLTNVGKVYDGGSWKGSGLLKKATGNPSFKWFRSL